MEPDRVAAFQNERGMGRFERHPKTKAHRRYRDCQS
jgi:hypothetical protein